MRSLSSFLLLIPVIVVAQSDPERDTTRTFLFDPVTVTATRTEVARNSISSTVTVIPHSSIASRPDRSILSIVSEQVPGVFVTERGILGFGSNTGAGQLTIRGVGGSPNAQVLVLVDGRPQYMGLFGHPLGDSYLATATERVEVLRGPASLLYGSNAMGGVINIITGSSPDQGWNVGGSATYGSFNTSTMNGRAGYRAGTTHVTASGTYQHTDGHRPQSDFSIQSGYVQGGTSITPEISVVADAALTTFRTNDPGTVTDPFTDHWVDILRGYAGFSIDNRCENIEGALRFVHNFGDHTIFDPESFRSTDDMTSLSLYQTLRLLPGNSLTIGADYKRYGGNVTAGPVYVKLGASHVQEYALYMHARQHIGRFVFDGGLRLDHNEVFGTETIPQLGASFRASDATTIRSTIAKGYRSPAVFQFYLFVPTNTTGYIPASTTSLMPERSWSYELGVQHTISDQAHVELVGYQIEVENLVQATPMPPPRRFINAGSLTNRGIELTGTILPFTGAEVRGSYAFFSHAERVSAVPEHKVFIGWRQSWENVIVSGAFQAISGMNGMDDSTLKPLPNYCLLGIDAKYMMSSLASVLVKMDNILNAQYQTIYGYPMPGRVVSMGMEVGL